MAHISVWLVATGQLLLWLGMGWCYLTSPGLLPTAEQGVSNYGTHKPTVLPYSLALILVSLCSGLAGYFAASTSHGLRNLLYALAALYLATLLSTYIYQQSQGLRNIHIILGGIFYITQLLASTWLAWRLRTNVFVLALFVLQLAGSLLSLLSILNIVRLLLIGQAITAVGFGALLTILVRYKTAMD